jgi:hypothetical protein
MDRTPCRLANCRSGSFRPEPVGERQHYDAQQVREQGPMIVNHSVVACVKSVCAASPGRCADRTRPRGPAPLLLATGLLDAEGCAADLARSAQGGPPTAVRTASWPPALAPLAAAPRYWASPSRTGRARSPLTRRGQLRQELPGGYVLPRRLAIHVGLHGCLADGAMLGHLVHYLPHVRVGDSGHSRVGSPIGDPTASPGSRAQRWGGVVVVSGEG